jgi:hypothetical protein
VIGTDCTHSCESNCYTITTTIAPRHRQFLFLVGQFIKNLLLWNAWPNELKLCKEASIERSFNGFIKIVHFFPIRYQKWSP